MHIYVMVRASTRLGDGLCKALPMTLIHAKEASLCGVHPAKSLGQEKVEARTNDTIGCEEASIYHSESCDLVIPGYQPHRQLSACARWAVKCEGELEDPSGTLWSC